MVVAERYFSLIPWWDLFLRRKRRLRGSQAHRGRQMPRDAWRARSRRRAGYFWGYPWKPGPGLFSGEVSPDAVFRV